MTINLKFLFLFLNKNNFLREMKVRHTHSEREREEEKAAHKSNLLSCKSPPTLLRKCAAVLRALNVLSQKFKRPSTMMSFVFINGRLFSLL
jgi:hypothetical protein